MDLGRDERAALVPGAGSGLGSAVGRQPGPVDILSPPPAAPQGDADAVTFPAPARASCLTGRSIRIDGGCISKV